MKLNIDYKFIIKSLLASFVMSIYLLKIEPVGFIQFFASVVASALIYFMIMVVLKAFEKKELMYLKALLFKN